MKKNIKNIKTKFGNAKLYDDGYYRITSTKEGNFSKLLHRLIFEDYHDCKLDENDIIHHADFDKSNNHPSNLICMSQKAHLILHNFREVNKGIPKSEEHKKKLSEAHKGKHHTDETKNKISESKNTTGYFRVIKIKDKKYKQGFYWRYQYY